MFYYGSDDKQLAADIADKLSQGLNINNRGAKHHGWAMTKYPLMPAVLIEVDFISNTKFAEACKSKSYIKKIAKLIYQGVKKSEC